MFENLGFHSEYMNVATFMDKLKFYHHESAVLVLGPESSDRSRFACYASGTDIDPNIYVLKWPDQVNNFCFHSHSSADQMN